MSRYRCSRRTALTVAFVFALVLALLMVMVAVLEYLWLRDRPVVRGRFGAVRGRRLVISDQGQELTVHAFLGLPFAKVPRGPLRFKPPHPLDSPLGVRKRRRETAGHQGQAATVPATGLLPGPRHREHEQRQRGLPSPEHLGAALELHHGEGTGPLRQTARPVLPLRGGLPERREQLRAVRRPVPSRSRQPGRGGAQLPSRRAGVPQRSHEEGASRQRGLAGPAVGVRVDVGQHRLLRRRHVAVGPRGSRRRGVVSGLPSVLREHGVLVAQCDAIHTAEWRTLPQRQHVEGSEFLLGRAASEGVYTWFVAQHRSASGDVRRLAARLLGDEVLERWQTATGITLDANSPVTAYQQAVGDVLEACPMTELAEQLQAWQNRVYVYVLGYRPSYSSWTDENETVHFEDVELVFGKPLRHGVSSSDEDKKWSRTMIEIWATFARTGRAPHLGDAKWTLYDSAHPMVMKLGPKGVGEQSDDKAQECVIVRSGPTTTSTGHHGNGTAPVASATRASTTLRGCGIAVVALVCANVALRAWLVLALV
ncbi:uncharacterized protein LOC119404299 [Rhipicephalus sanguineus]|uniref:uncharacterized protein LOC119404299 n=1 Tax=Rhipicephalus sanguineus TaxID=34632 RepID=UPI0020C2ED7A|nr:uncharacterized protein LOC119404299 [Rhipicephalus sanguineus]